MGLLRAFVETEINILQPRKMESLTPDMRQVIDILTLDSRSPPKIVGSFKYKIHEYPADIDLYEGVYGCCTVEASKRKMAEYFKKMAGKIQRRRFTYLADFKAGIDERYYIDIGNYNPEKSAVEGYDADNIIHDIARLYEEKLFAKEEAVSLIRLVRTKPTAVEYQELRDAIRARYVLRWTLKEILEGRKSLPHGKEISLETAISQGTVVKADLWALVDDRFMEVTNWFMLTASDKGNTVYFSEKPDMYQKTLKREILMLKSPGLKKHMKLAKRMWIYAISKADHYTIKQLYPLFSSPVAKLYQIQSELEILIGMLEKLPEPPYHLISKQIAQFKTRIGSVGDAYLSGSDETRILRSLDKALRADKEKEKSLVIEELTDTFELIRDIVDKKAKDYLKNHIPKNRLVKLILQTAKRGQQK